MNYYLGIDIGATKSHALIADENGRAAGFGAAGPGNHEVVGWEGYRRVLREITRQALDSAGVQAGQIRGAGFGVAGYDWPSQRQPTLEGIAALGLNCPVEAVNDAVLGIFAGAGEGWGISIISGTGENCWGVDRNRRYAHMTGNGGLMGEYGGAGTIVYRALQAVAKEWGHRAPKTALTPAFIRRTGASDLDDMLEGLVLERYRLSAADAPLVFQVAEAGDAVAANVLRWAGEELADMINGVSRQLGFTDQPFEVVMIGSTFKGGDLLISPMKSAVRAVNPKARFVRLHAPPVVGAVLLGMEQAGINGHLIRTHLVQTANEFLHLKGSEADAA